MFLLVACNGTVNSGATATLEGYETEIIPGTNVTLAVKKDADGNLIEKGYISNGKRNGIWLTYYDGNHAGKVKSIASYSDGILNGPYYELSNRGQIEKEINYANNQYEGKYAVYKYGRVTQEASYSGNQLNGAFKEYYNDGKVQKEINYKDGKQHGLMRYYNEDGDVTVEYEYKNGEKIRGGMVEKNADSE